MTHSPAPEEKSLEGMVEAVERKLFVSGAGQNANQYAHIALSAIAAYLGTTESGLVKLRALTKAEPNPEWEAIAAAAHAEITAEQGIQPFDTLAMLERWKADAEPANQYGQVSFSRAMLDSATDALRMALQISRDEHLRAEQATTELSALRVRVSELEELGKGARDALRSYVDNCPHCNGRGWIHIDGRRGPIQEQCQLCDPARAALGAAP